MKTIITLNEIWDKIFKDLPKNANKLFRPAEKKEDLIKELTELRNMYVIEHGRISEYSDGALNNLINLIHDMVTEVESRNLFSHLNFCAQYPKILAKGDQYKKIHDELIESSNLFEFIIKEMKTKRGLNN